MSKVKFISALLVICVLLSCFVSCSGKDKIVIQMGEVSTGIDYSSDGNGFVPESDYIGESLYKYLYLYFKNSILSSCKEAEAYGQDVTGDKNISVDDTEAFWNCIFKEENISYAQYLQNVTNDTFKDILAIEAAAEEFGYKLPEEYGKNFEKAVAEQIVYYGNEYLKGETEIADKDGNLYDWAKDRWTMQLAGEGISSKDWERVFYLYVTVLLSDVSTQLSEKGIISAEPDDVLKENEIKYFMENNMKFKYIAYYLKDDNEKVSVSEDSSEDVNSSEDVSEDLSVDISSEENVSNEASADLSENISEEVSDDESSKDTAVQITGKEFNEQLKAKCEDIYKGLLDGTLKFDDEVKKSDIYSYVKDTPDGVIGTFSQMESAFGESVKELKVGDIKMYVNGGAVHIIEVQELKESDCSITEDYLKTLRARSVSAAFEKLLDKYKEAVIYDEDILSKYLKPWKIK